MRKNYFILFLCFISTLTIFGQDKHAKRNPFQEKNTLTDYLLKSMHPFETQLPDSAIITEKEGKQYQKMLFSHGANNNINIDIYGKLIDNEWDKNNRKSYIYDSEGRIIQEEYLSWDGEKQEWIYNYGYKYTYYHGDKILSSEYFDSFDNITSTPKLSEKTEYAYDTNKFLISYKKYYDSDNDGILELDEIAKCEYTIDADGYLNYITYTKLSEEPDDRYEPSLKTKIKYNENAYLIYRESTEWYNNQWQDDDIGLMIKTYTNEKLISEKWYAKDETLLNWKFIDGSVYTYNEKGNIILEEELCDNEDVASYTTRYYYSSLIGIEENAFTDSKIQFVDGVLTVNNTNTETISLYSSTGVFLHSFVKQEGKHSVILNPIKGIIIIKGSSGWTKKLITK